VVWRYHSFISGALQVTGLFLVPGFKKISVTSNNPSVFRFTYPNNNSILSLGIVCFDELKVPDIQAHFFAE